MLLYCIGHKQDQSIHKNKRIIRKVKHPKPSVLLNRYHSYNQLHLNSRESACIVSKRVQGLEVLLWLLFIELFNTLSVSRSLCKSLFNQLNFKPSLKLNYKLKGVRKTLPKCLSKMMHSKYSNIYYFNVKKYMYIFICFIILNVFYYLFIFI